MASVAGGSYYDFIVGENGRRSGLAIAKTGRVELRILVLPKMWRHENPRVVFEPGLNSALRVSVICNEQQRFRLSEHLLVPYGASWTDLVACCVGVSKKSACRRRSALVKGLPPGDTEVKEPDDWSSRPNAHTIMRSEWRDFLSLWYRTKLVCPSKKLFLPSLDVVSALASSDSLLAPLVSQVFVMEVLARIQQMRPGYVRTTASSRFIRGRMDITSAVVAMRGGRSTVRCTYDSFGLDTPILQVIAAALREVAGGGASYELPTAPKARVDAAWLLGKLEAVSVLERVAASRLGAAVLPRLHRLDQDWRYALRLACMVLNSEGLDPIAASDIGYLGWQGERTPSYIFDLNTSTMWECIVREAWWSAAERPRGRYAWASSGSASKKQRRPMRADILSKDGMSVADVKYKTFVPEPSPSDSRQAFVHSHIYGARKAFVIYAKISEEPPESGEEFSRIESTGRGCVTLKTLGVVFPGRNAVADDESWQKYMGELRNQLVQARDMTAP